MRFLLLEQAQTGVEWLESEHSSFQDPQLHQRNSPEATGTLISLHHNHSSNLQLHALITLTQLTSYASLTGLNWFLRKNRETEPKEINLADHKR